MRGSVLMGRPPRRAHERPEEPRIRRSPARGGAQGDTAEPDQRALAGAVTVTRLPGGARRCGWELGSAWRADAQLLVGSGRRSVVWKGSSVTAEPPPAPQTSAAGGALRDLAEVPAVEVVGAAAVHLMSAAAVKLGLAEDVPEAVDLGEARTLITALAGLVSAAAPELGGHHAAPLRDGLKTLQLAFREASAVPDLPGQGPGERLTGPVYPATPSS